MEESAAAEAVEETAEDHDRPETLDEALGNGELIDQIESELGAPDPEVEPLEYEKLSGSAPAGGESVRDLDLIADIDVQVAVEFGRVDIPVKQLLQLRRGSLVELHRRPEAQVTVLANGKPIALGDIVVVDGQVGVHIVELIDPDAPPPPVEPPAQVVLEQGDAELPADDEAEADDGESSD